MFHHPFTKIKHILPLIIATICSSCPYATEPSPKENIENEIMEMVSVPQKIKKAKKSLIKRTTTYLSVNAFLNNEPSNSIALQDRDSLATKNQEVDPEFEIVGSDDSPISSSPQPEKEEGKLEQYKESTRQRCSHCMAWFSIALGCESKKMKRVRDKHYKQGPLNCCCCLDTRREKKKWREMCPKDCTKDSFKACVKNGNVGACCFSLYYAFAGCFALSLVVFGNQSVDLNDTHKKVCNSTYTDEKSVNGFSNPEAIDPFFPTHNNISCYSNQVNNFSSLLDVAYYDATLVANCSYAEQMEIARDKQNDFICAQPGGECVREADSFALTCVDEPRVAPCGSYYSIGSEQVRINGSQPYKALFEEDTTSIALAQHAVDFLFSVKNGLIVLVAIYDFMVAASVFYPFYAHIDPADKPRSGSMGLATFTVIGTSILAFAEGGWDLITSGQMKNILPISKLRERLCQLVPAGEAHARAVDYTIDFCNQLSAITYLQDLTMSHYLQYTTIYYNNSCTLSYHTATLERAYQEVKATYNSTLLACNIQPLFDKVERAYTFDLDFTNVNLVMTVLLMVSLSSLGYFILICYPGAATGGIFAMAKLGKPKKKSLNKEQRKKDKEAQDLIDQQKIDGMNDKLVIRNKLRASLSLFGITGALFYFAQNNWPLWGKD